MHLADEELQSDDGIDDDDEEDQQGDVEERNHGFNDGVQHHLQTWQQQDNTHTHTLRGVDKTEHYSGKG